MGSYGPHPDDGGRTGSILTKLGHKFDTCLSVGNSVMVGEMKLTNNMAARIETQEKSSQTVPPAQPPPRPQEQPESVKRIARELAYEIVYYKSGVKKLQPSSKYAVTLRRTVDELLHRHEILFNGIVNKLEISQKTMRNVLDEMFKDKNFNWGRIVSIYAFGGRLAQHAGEIHKQELIDQIAEWLAEYVIEELSSWIHSAGGWDAFYEYFPEQKSLEERLWRGLLVTAVGLGALATMVAAR